MLGSGTGGGGHGPCAQDAADLGGLEVEDGLRGRGGGDEDGREGEGGGGGPYGHHSSRMSAVSRSVRPPRSTSKRSCQRPGMWNSNPSAR